MSERKTKKLEDIVTQFIDYRGKTPTKTETGVPLITAKIVKDGRLLPYTEYIAHGSYHVWMTRGIPAKNDVIITTEAPLGEVALMPDGEIALAQRIIVMHTNPDECDSIYLKYFLQWDVGKQCVLNKQSGSTVFGISAAELKKTQVTILDSIEEQKNIAQVLSTIDHKIELNRRLNDNLEAMAQALYDYWFVQFDFPDENGKPYKSSGGKMVWNEVLKREIPEGWTNSTVQDYIIIGNGKDHKSVGRGEIPCYGSGGFMFGVAKAIYTGESVLLPRKGSLNNVMLVDGSFWTVDTMFYSEPKMKGAAKYVYYGIQVYDLASMNLGTGVPSMTSTRLYSLKLVGAPYTILAKFDVVVSPLLSKARSLLAENKVLAAQRDFLLPLLMNGQVQVKPLNYRLADD